MNRFDILELLVEYQTFFNDKKLVNFTFCLMDKTLINIPLSTIFNNKLIDVYMANGSRVYQKTYEIDKLKDNILELFFDIVEPLKINKTDITSLVNDPFYLKDIRKINFITLFICPIIEEQLVGFALFYFNDEQVLDKGNNFPITMLRLNQLRKKIINNEVSSLNSIYERVIIESNQPLVIIEKDNVYYLNDNLRKLWHEKYAKVEDDNKLIKKIKKIIASSKTKYLKTNDYQFYYWSNNLSNENELLSLEMLNKINREETFTLIYGHFNADTILDNLKLVSDVLIDYQGNKVYYKISTNGLVVKINNILTNEMIEKIKHDLLPNYIIVINSEKDFTKLMNLEKLLVYIDEELPEVYSLNKYQDYLKELNEDIALYDYKFQQAKGFQKVINSTSQKEVGIMISLPPSSKRNASFYRNYQANMLKAYRDESVNKKPLIITFLTSQLLTRQTLEIAKYLINNQSIPWLIIHHDLDLSKESIKILGDGIVKLRNMGIKVIIDKTIYMCSALLYFEQICDGTFFGRDECEVLSKYPNAYLGLIEKYFYNEHEILIYEVDINKMASSIFYLNPIKGS